MKSSQLSAGISLTGCDTNDPLLLTILRLVLAVSSQVKSSHLYLYSAFNNTDCVKALNSIKLEDRVSVMYNNKIKHSVFS